MIIEATPTFEGATRMCITVLQRGSAEGRRMAEDELLRYARELDRIKANSGAAFDAADTPTSEDNQ